ncbi:MAG: lamin tail domain-containing protein, partial [bacterium]|nr:lamin tail domain-containing protein [bacterium]
MKYKLKQRKNLIVLTGGLILISGFLLMAFNNPDRTLAYSYKTTHPDLTREVITFYELSTGKKFTDEQKQWIIQGSIDEDLAPRWLNHFYDPVFERGLSTAIPGINGYLAKNWAQFSSYQTINIGNIFNLWTGNGPVISGSEWGDFSYEAAVKNYSQNKEKKAYLALGHVIHLIEDVTVPEHTRNDPHPGGQDSSFYENWAKENSGGLTQDLGKRLFGGGYKPIVYVDLETYFNNLASYTNNHFFSPDTIKSEIYQKPKIVFEDGVFAYGKDENGELFDLAEITVNKSRNKIYYLNNSQILQEYWLRLSRQAVINSAGVISLFLNQAEAAKQVELAKQKVEAQQVAQKSSFFSSIINLFKNPGENNQPALTITSEPTPAKPKINQIQPKLSVVNTNPKPPAANPMPLPVPSAPIASQNPAPTIQNTPNQTNNQTTQQPQSATPVVYGGGGGGSSSSNAQQTSQNQNAATSSESLSVQTFNVGDLIINEIMYDLEGADTLNNKSREWVEIYNNSGRAITLAGGNSGWRFSDGSNHILNEPPTNGSQGSMAISVGGYAVLAGDAATFLVDHPSFSGTFIDTVMSLKNSTSTVKIIAPDGAVIDEVTYYNSWGANGNGKTLERKSASGGSNDSTNWAQSSAPGGTPGAANNWLLISEINSDSATSTPETATSTESLVALGTDISATTTITGNTTWTLAGSPYRLFFNNQNRPTVAPSGVLTVEPGVKIIPQTSGATALEIKGTFNAIATSGAPIIFTSIADADDLISTTPQSGDWLNIAFSAGSQGNLDYVEFRYGGQGLERPVKEMVKIIGATVNISHSTFINSQSIALRLVDSNGTVENSTFSDNACGISVDSLVLPSSGTDGGCAGSLGYFPAVAETVPQIRNNQFIRNRLIAVEVRNGAAPVLNGNLFINNGYPVRIESSYPSITNSRLENSTTSPNILGGIAINDYTHFRKDFTLKKDNLPYILEASGGYSPYVDAGATLTIEPGVIFKTGHTFTALNVNGSLIASSTPDNPIVFTSLKDDTKGGDTNGDGSITSPQNSDWANIKFFAGSVGNFANTIFNYGGYGFIPHLLPPTNVLAKDFPTVNIGHNYMSVSGSNWISTSGNAFNKVIIHNFATVNPQNFNYKIGIKNSRDEFIAAVELPNLKNIS